MIRTGLVSLNNETISDSSDQEESIIGMFENKNFEEGRWTDSEHKLFLEALVLYGNEWKAVQEHIKTRSSTQARSHAQKFFIRLKNEFCEESGEVGQIKQKIYQKFKYELQDKFNPKQVDFFLDMMIKLIYISETNIPSKCPLIKKKIKIRNKPLKAQQDFITKKQQNLPIQSRKKKAKINSIFLIKKDISRKNSVASFKETQKDSNKKFNCENKSVSKKNPITASCINFYTINMVNNSTNNYFNVNTKDISSGTSMNSNLSQHCNTFSNPQDDNSGNQYKAETYSNPFHIDFDSTSLPNNGIDNNNCDCPANIHFNDYFSLFN